MPMIDVYSFADKHALARDLGAALMRWEKFRTCRCSERTLRWINARGGVDQGADER
jgi:hypothetical protein